MKLARILSWPMKLRAYRIIVRPRWGIVPGKANSEGLVGDVNVRVQLLGFQARLPSSLYSPDPFHLGELGDDPILRCGKSFELFNH